jgi:hypothetical protein
MPSRLLRPLASATALAWILAQAQGVATAVHVAEDHAHHGHHHAHHHEHDHAPAAAAGGGVAVAPDHTHGEGHVHGLPEVLPGVRNDGRAGLAAPAAVPGAGFVIAAGDRAARTSDGVRRPDPPPLQAPTVLLL